MTGTAATEELRAWQRDAERAVNRRDFRHAHALCLRILTQDPQFADALFLLAMIAAEHRNFAKAAEVIERALRIDATRAEYHAHLGRCLVALHQPRAAFEAAVRALALAPVDALTLDTIGVVMTRTGAHGEALEPFRRATTINPDNAAFQYNLGASLQFIGEFAAAESAFRRAIAINPNYPRAWSSLAQVARTPFSAADVAQLQQALAGTAVDTDELHLCHALARHCEDHGHYAEAFGYLERGKRRKRAALDYDFDADRALFAAATSLAIAPAAGACPSAEPIFIVGMPRTGTTLVERILSNHPEVFSAGELTNFALVLKRAAHTASNRVLDPETLAAGEHMNPGDLGMAYLESTRPRTGHTPHFIDKMPLNFFYVPLILRALPNARIICVRRNALDTCLSNYRQLFATSFSYYNYSYDLLDTGRYYQLFDRLCRHYREAKPANYLEIHYEDVVDHTEREARALVGFCGLDWHDACLQFHANAAPVATASSVQVRQPIYRSAVDRWRKYETQLAPLRQLLDESRSTA